MSTVATAQPAFEPAAGFTLDSKENRPDHVPPQKGEYSVASRAVALSTYFLSGALAINLSQFLGTPLYLVNQDWYNAWIAFTKQSFGLLTMTLTQTFAPTKVIVSGDASVRGQLRKSADGHLVLDFPERLVLIANHQIYTDWLYLWWVAYCNGMHGRLYIILKESLKKIPILGWGMQFNQFIFLKRNWEQDKPNMSAALQKLNKPADPMWLLLFPEGTNLAPNTRERSAKWAAKNNLPDCKHVLLPRSTGLHFCVDQLKDTVDYIYDCTVAYEGVPRGEYAQDIFTLKAGYLEGRPPKSVSMHWRRFAIKDIPLHNDKAFELWLLARWREKDVLMEQYLQNGCFPADTGMTKYKSGKTLRGCGHMEVPIQSSHWYEFLQIFAPMGILAMVLYIFYGDLPKRFWKSINKQALQSGTEDIKKAGVQAGKEAKSLSTSLSGLTLDSIFDPDQQKETFMAGATAVQKLITSSSAQRLLGRADFMQQFLSDPQKMVEKSITNKQKSFMQQLAQEESRRAQQGLPTAPPPRPVANGTTPKPAKTFWDELNAEQNSRLGGSVVSSTLSSKHQGTFWKDLKAAEIRQGPRNVSGTTGKGKFWQDLKAAENKKASATASPKSKGTFWDEIKVEQNNRHGSVHTLPSDVSTEWGTETTFDTDTTITKTSMSRASMKRAPSSLNPNRTGPSKLNSNTVVPRTRPPKLNSAPSTVLSAPKLPNQIKSAIKPVVNDAAQTPATTTNRPDLANVTKEIKGPKSTPPKLNNKAASKPTSAPKLKAPPKLNGTQSKKQSTPKQNATTDTSTKATATAGNVQSAAPKKLDGTRPAPKKLTPKPAGSAEKKTGINTIANTGAATVGKAPPKLNA